MSDDKFNFFEFDSLFRFEFTGSSLAWGFSIGTLLACHKYSKTGLPMESVKFGGLLGFLTASGIWGYNLYKFTISRHVLQQQNYSRQESAMKAKFIENYFKSKYNLQDSSSEHIALAINDLDDKWKNFDNLLTEEDPPNSN
jgi:hypothetical protein